MNFCNKTPQSPRIAWIDNIRFFAILCVILYHSSQLVINKPFYYGWVIESFNMALFFFLSGISSYKSLNKINNYLTLKDFLVKRFTRILLPCIFVSLLVFQKPCSFWYLLTLFYYLASFSVIKYVCARFRVSDYVPYLFFLLLTLIEVPKIGNNQEFVTIFTIGMMCSKFGLIDILFSLPSTKKIYGIAISFLVWSIMLPLYKSFYLRPFYTLLELNDYHTFLARQFIALAFIVGCCLFFMLKVNKLTKISKMGGATLGIYIIHTTIIAICEKFGFIYNANFELYGKLIQYLLFIILTLTTISVVKLLGLWSWTNFLVLGNKLKK